MAKMKPELREIPIHLLCRGKYQPRTQFDQESLAELAASIQASGLIQPIVVRPLQGNTFEIVAGERRWRAAQLAGFTTVMCLVKEYTDEQTAAVTTIENINRVDLNPIEEAKGYQRLFDEFNYPHEEIAAVVGKSRTKITNSLRLLKLDPRVQQLLIDGKLSEGHGKVLAGVSNEKQLFIAKLCAEKDWNIRKLESELKNITVSGDMGRPDPNIKHLERRLAEYIGCKVNIDFEAGKGKLKIDFHNLEILEGLLERLGYKNAGSL